MKYKDIMATGKIEYIAYIDASGDDGFNFSPELGHGSSDCFTVAMFVTSVTDIEHNVQILNRCKELVGHKDYSAELKYSRLRRHPNAKKIHDLIFSECKGTLVIFNAFKRDHITTGEKVLVTEACHTLPIKSLPGMPGLHDENFCVVIDRMKRIDQDSVLNAVSSLSQKDIDSVKICYMDSKDARTPLIQLADFFAGVFRNYFEEIYNDQEYFDSLKICSKCRKGNLYLRARREAKRCLFRKRHISIVNKPLIDSACRIFYKGPENKHILFYGVAATPFELTYRFSFMDCIIDKK